MKILSTSDAFSEFISSLKTGEIFGYSRSFKPEWVIEQALQCGVKATPPAKNTPERKQYGDYVLKMRATYPVHKSARLDIDSARYVTEIAKRPRKCTGYGRVAHLIPQHSTCVVESVPDTLPSGKLIYKKNNYCVECARARLQKISKRIELFISSTIASLIDNIKD